MTKMTDEQGEWANEQGELAKDTAARAETEARIGELVADANALKDAATQLAIERDALRARLAVEEKK